MGGMEDHRDGDDGWGASSEYRGRRAGEPDEVPEGPCGRGRRAGEPDEVPEGPCGRGRGGPTVH
ncbi:MAG TPA: hypothetical protein ENN44_02615 [Methanoculleus sp.]|nr:hypothetical protein [Methanoculleus sp.]